ncbi:Gfo/Idh/MocA family oxidoreductase [Sphingomonas sp. BK235]|uniref:Gfo/Idh/MocA family oxidoreductase n=1 Tax=Sphingomonas sp. BK235 TaxID=2512131 RepID=UPI00104E3F2F|nr:Gfo/Idh/MocA family oxidoreductase [Sphingomonas sp. BK235]TCP36094.1 putative dehydrogenase [Sphingomonas sp. BK235]
MKIAFVGCGFVFDIYMRTIWAHDELDVRGVFDIDGDRQAVVCKHYGYYGFASFDELLNDPNVDIVINLTNIRSHYEVTKRALEAGKHVYSEKPLTTEVDQSRELFALAAEKGLVFTGAPSNVFSDSVSTMWKAIRDGAIGKPVLVHAELDDNPVHLVHAEGITSPTGAPWPLVEELQEGCTFEHVGYHLVWICAMFGPATHVTAFSKALIDHKTDLPLDPADTPDYSVACLNFANGMAARVTCSFVAPRDHRMRIIGEEGELTGDSYRHYQSPVFLERFSAVSLSARKAFTVREQPLLGRRFGVGGQRVPLLRSWKSHAVEAEDGSKLSLKQRLVSYLRRKQIYSQDKMLGVAEMVRAMKEGHPQPLSPEFLMHVNELTLLIQRAGPTGIATSPTTTFESLQPLPEVANARIDYRASYRPRPLERALAGAMAALHRK